MTVILNHDIMFDESIPGYLSTNVAGVSQVIDVLYNVCDQSRDSANSPH